MRTNSARRVGGGIAAAVLGAVVWAGCSGWERAGRGAAVVDEAGHAGQAGDDGPRTVAEKSGYGASSRLSDVQDYLGELAKRSERVWVGDIGKTGEGRPIPLAVVADPPVKSAEAARRSGKLVVLLVGGIHSGESDGKEALLALARELAVSDGGETSEDGGGEHRLSPKAEKVSGTGTGLLKELVAALVPSYNVDGGEKVGDVAKIRPGQLGPTEVGIRENAAGLDLNRDFVKLEAPETRALVSFINEWDPAVVVDTHTTNGSLHRYLLTYDGPKNPAGDRDLLEYARGSFLPGVVAMAKEAGGFDTFWYGNFEGRERGGHDRWETYPDSPRYGVNYVGMRNRLSVLTESYSYAPFKERVRAQRVFVRAVLERASAERGKIRELVQAADRRASEEAGGTAAPRVAVTSKMVASPEKVKVLGFEEEARDGRPVAKGERDYDVELLVNFEAERSVTRPFAYAYSARLTGVTGVLQRHGIKVEETREDIELEVRGARVVGLSRAMKAFQGHELAAVKVAEDGGLPASAGRRLPAGSMLVRTAQPLGNLACFLLEPESSDGLAVWNFLDAELKEGEEFPVWRVERAAAVMTIAAPPLADAKDHGQAQGGLPMPPRKLTFEEAYESRRAPNLNGSPVGGISWIDDDHFVQVKDGKAFRVEAATGLAEPLLDTVKIAEALRAVPGVDRRAAEAAAGAGGLRMDKGRTGGYFERGNDLYYVRLDGTGARRLTSTPEREEGVSFSPDGKWIAFVRGFDLYVVDVDTGTERALTSGGTDRVRNGKNDWVYFEEVFNRSWNAYWWSPDSTRIAYLRIDDTAVKTFPVVTHPAKGDPKVEMTPFPKPGEPNPRVAVFTVEVVGGSPREVELGDYSPEDMLVMDVGWWPDSSKVYAYVANRVQTRVDLVRAPADGGAGERVLRETTQAWVEAPPPLKFLKDGSFLLMSERSGWKHAYRYTGAGKLMGAVTEGEWEARNVACVDEEGGRLLVSGTLDSSIAENLYRVPLDGGKPERLTKEPGSHRVEVSPGGKYFVDSWSTIDLPTRVVVRDGRDGSVVRVLDTNPVRDLAKYQLGKTELVQIKARDGFVLEGTVTWPPDYVQENAGSTDRSEQRSVARYPVWFNTYGGPHSPTVTDSWGGGRVWDQVLAASGIVVFHCDPRSASGKGAVSAWTCYKRLGVPELEDIEDAIKWVGEQPWADASRVGMNGHSYGGFMTAYALTHSKLFSAGMAGAPVTDWRDYDSIYTERFMLTPAENPEGYKASSVVGAAKNLHGKLLLLHGMIDDNVHFENTTRLARAFQDARKQFEMMIYPDARHGIGGRQYQRLMYDFIVRTMGVEGTAGSPEKQEEDAPAAGDSERPRRRRGRG